MWTAIFQNTPIIAGFTVKEMITYLLIGYLFQVMVRNFLADVIARDIKNGTLSMYLIQPMSYFSFVLIKEIGRISVATILSMLSQLLVILLFYQQIIFNFNPLYLATIFIMLIFAFLSELLISYLIGLIAFWTDEVEGIYSTTNSLKKFFSGGFFPLNLLPHTFLTISFLLPFAYSFYVPTQLYLNKLSIQQGFQGLFIQLIWIGILLAVIKLVWNAGIKRYEGVGI
jgi:ABC-2 type transport system permease protein